MCAGTAVTSESAKGWMYWNDGGVMSTWTNEGTETGMYVCVRVCVCGCMYVWMYWNDGGVMSTWTNEGTETGMSRVVDKCIIRVDLRNALCFC
jgi:hypothetical protein